MPDKNESIGSQRTRQIGVEDAAEIETQHRSALNTTVPEINPSGLDMPTTAADGQTPVASHPGSASSAVRSFASHSSMPDGLLGRFHYVRTLGEGGFGVVLQVWDPELQMHRAIKVPHRQLIESGKVDPEAYVREARKLARLGKHPGIVEVFDVQRMENGTPYLVSEFISGGSLASRIKSGRMDWREAARLIAQIADAIGHAHSKGVVHRDLKPANILLTDEGKPVVVDFGLALGDDEFSYRPSVCGTYCYMSPQQVNGAADRVDGRSDIFSLGVILYQLIAGRLPYKSHDVSSIKREIVHDQPTPVRQYNPVVPPQLESICRKAMAKEPVDRYSTAADFAAALRAVADEGAGEGAKTQGVLSRTSTLWLSIAATAAVFALAAALVMNRSRSTIVPDSALAPAAGAAAAGPNLEILMQKKDEPGSFRRLAIADLPLHVGDKLQFHVTVPKPMYAYIYWIDFHGKPERYWPPTESDLAKQQPISELDSPAKTEIGPESQWWQVTATGGPEIIFVGVSDKPLGASELGDLETHSGPFAASLQNYLRNQHGMLAATAFPKQENKTLSDEQNIDRLRGGSKVPVVSLKTDAADDTILRQTFQAYHGFVVETKE
jgi:hypothetical protein